MMISLEIAQPSSISAALNTPVATAESNLLTNPSLENGKEGWTLHTFRSKGQVAPDAAEKHGGKPSIRIENPQADDSLLYQKVMVKPATRYRLTGWIKAKDVGSMDPKSKNGASLSIRGGFLKSESVTKTSEWKKVTLDFSTKAETEIELGPRLGHHGAEVSGTAWFAELSLTELGPFRR